MPVTGWRRPALAPVYALVTSFLVVLGVSAFATGPATVLRVVPSQGEPKDLAGTRVEVNDRDGNRISAGELSAQGTFPLPDEAAGGTVCLRLPAPWRVTDLVMADQCTVRALPKQLGEELPVAVALEARVTVVSAAGEVVTGTKVTVQRGSTVEIGQLDDNGSYNPLAPLNDRTVCVDPPHGWRIEKPATSDGRCVQLPANVAEDVVFTLVRSP